EVPHRAVAAKIDDSVEVLGHDLLELERVGKVGSCFLIALEPLHVLGMVVRSIASRIDGRLTAGRRRQRDIRAGILESVVGRAKFLQPEARLRSIVADPIVRAQHHENLHRMSPPPVHAAACPLEKGPAWTMLLRFVMPGRRYPARASASHKGGQVGAPSPTANLPAIALLRRAFQKRLGNTAAQSGLTVARRSLQRDPVAVDKDAKATLLLVPRIPPVDADAALVQVPRAGVAGARCVLVGGRAARQEIDIEGVAGGGGAGKR